MSIDGITGIVVPIVTPMDESGGIDQEGTGRLLDYLISGGVAGVFALGSTGEFSSLTQGQRLEFIQKAADAIRGRVPLFVGVSSASPADTTEMMEQARRCKADAVVALAPYYFPFADQAALMGYFEDLADRAPLPLVLYNSGGGYGKGSPLTPESVASLARHPRIIGIKDVTDFSSMLSMVVLTGGHRNPVKPFSVFAGNDFQMAIGVCFGTSGGVNSLANVAPRLYVEACRLALARDVKGLGDLATPGSLMSRIHAMHELYRVPPNAIAAIKGALSVLGICGAAVARPLEDLRADGAAAIHSILRKAGLI